MTNFWSWFLCSVLWIASIQFSNGQEKIDFARDIRPILSDRCFKCHGFDDAAREADLGLHTFDAATADLGGYQAIKPGDAENSEIIYRMESDDRTEAMPPAKANKPRLTPEEIAKFKQWINEGAKYEQHWAFVHPRERTSNIERPTPNIELGENEIDFFVGRRLKQEGFNFSPEADPHTLIRRVYLDLIGIPPTPNQADEFAGKIKSEGFLPAMESVIDELLASPQYGEKWARHWLDLSRYADTNGYEKDRPRSIWPYRDWVITALNADMPYDQFTIEQLAGDMLPNATLDQKIATGFHRNTMMNEEGGIDPLEYRYHAMVDRVATTGTVWMGLTTGCAQCHTHKFDPITHTDYFALFALLNNADEPDLDVPTEAVHTSRADIRRQVRREEHDLMSKIDPDKFQKWLESEKAAVVEWKTIRPTEAKSNLPRLAILKDDSVLASGDFTKRDVYDLKFDLSGIEKPITAIRLEALPHPSLPAHGPGTAYYEGRKGDFFLSEMIAKIDSTKVGFHEPSISFGKIYIGSGKVVPEGVYDGNGSSGWSTATAEGRRHELVLNFKKPISGKVLDLNLLFERHFVAALGRFRISVSTDEKIAKARASDLDLATAEESELKRLYVRESPEFAEARKEIEALEKKVPAFPTTLVLRERPADNTRPTFRHHRGEYLQVKEPVAPAVPAIFVPIESEANRLNFAKWLVSEKNPLAARVAVNRAWRAFFGRGIVHTAGDFGLQSKLPSHPDLLDWLAVDLIDDGWSMKRLHKKIVLSRTYRQSSVVTPESLRTDPKNILLGRGPRFRMSGEMIRDSALAASGLLTQKIGGPSVYPPQPASVAAAAYGNTKWPAATGPDRYRRSLYTFSKRTAPFAAYLTFDGPTGESCLARREISNTPLQSLTLLNDEMFLETARALAASCFNPTEAFRQSEPAGLKIFRTVLTREPTDAELAGIDAFFKTQLARLESGELSAKDICGKDDPTLASWTLVARVILNLDEAVTKS
ncbi:MAG: DUF1553 domain-containing protein [Verrucomicrobiales bacterium]|nr:DUF1553 domain-containing protein [Verrucomicrobiales bacterium]